MQINTQRLALRPTGPEYLESTFAYSSDPLATRMMVFLPMASREEALQYLEDAAAEWAKPRPTHYRFAIIMDGEHVGGVNLSRLEDDPSWADLGWIVRRDRWRRGIAFEAASALMDHAHREWGIRRFIAQCDSENEASYRLMEKLGMRRIGCAGGRKNRASDEERFELTYELVYPE